jgi:hypothetical protein
MEFVIFDLVDANGLEGSQADVKRDFSGCDAALADAVEDLWGEMKSGGGGCDRATLLGVNGLIAFAIAGGIRARDVGWERDVADAIECGEEIVHALDFALDHTFAGGLEADVAFAELGAREDFGLQFVLLSEEEAFADADLAAGANQAFPIIGVGGELASQQNFHAALEEITRGGIARAEWLSASACATAVEPGGKDARVIEDDQIAALQQVGEVAEQAIGITAAGSLQMQQAGTVTGRERFLSNEFGGKVKLEIGNQHGVRL